MSENIILLGVLFLGGFVGFLLGLALRVPENINLKLAVAVIGAALGGAPIIFMQDLAFQKWMYPVGLVVGFLWVRLISARTLVTKRPKKDERIAWYVGWLDTFAIVGVTLVVVAFTMFFMSEEPTESAPETTNPVNEVTRKDMPCRWAWVFLGRYSHQKSKYELPPAFRYADNRGPASPIPGAGDQIILVTERSLLVNNYASAEEGHKCNSMLDPPLGYRPETEMEFKAGSLSENSLVWINQVSLMPSPESEPVYVWALVGPN
jgi:hypothetical protein